LLLLVLALVVVVIVLRRIVSLWLGDGLAEVDMTIDMAILGTAAAIDNHVCQPLANAEECALGGQEELDISDADFGTTWSLCVWASSACSMGPTMRQEMTCSETAEADCSGDCEWWSDEMGRGGCSASEAFHVSLMCNEMSDEQAA